MGPGPRRSRPPNVCQWGTAFFFSTILKFFGYPPPIKVFSKCSDFMGNFNMQQNPGKTCLNTRPKNLGPPTDGLENSTETPHMQMAVSAGRWRSFPFSRQ